MQLAKRLDNFKEYIFVKLGQKVKEVELATGRKVFNLGVGSPDISPSELYIRKLQEYVRDSNAHMYPGYGAIPELREGIKAWHKTRFNTELNEKQLYPVNGAKDALVHIAMALLDSEDEVLVPDPGYPGFTGSAELIGAKAVSYDLPETNKFKPDLGQLEKLITARTRFLIVNFPSNPTGVQATKEDLISYVEFAKKHELWLIYDNAYSEIYFGEKKPLSILEIDGAFDVALEIFSFSKTFSFAGYRMGWVAGNEMLVGALAKVKSQVDSGMSLPLQRLGGYALANPDDAWLDAMRNTYKQRQLVVAEYLRDLGLEFELADASLYLWAKIPDRYENSEQFSMELLEKKQVLLTPGTAFGKNGARYVRVSICVDMTKLGEYY